MLVWLSTVITETRRILAFVTKEWLHILLMFLFLSLASQLLKCLNYVDRELVQFTSILTTDEWTRLVTLLEPSDTCFSEAQLTILHHHQLLNPDIDKII